MFEIFTVFVPICEVIKLWIMSKKTTESMTKYLSSSSSTQFNRSASVDVKSTPSSSLAEKGQMIEVLDESSSDRLYTMDGLEQTLRTNSNELQEFAALSEFSGENIAFLREVERWKSSWPETLNSNDEQQMIGAFNQALRIYAAFISTHDAEFPLNIASQSLKHMETIFEKPARVLFGEKTVNPTAPFDEPFASSSSDIHDPQASYTGEVPAAFDMTILDPIQDHVKYLVLTNTWPKFVESIRRRSMDSQDTGYSWAGSERTFRSWLSHKRVKLLSLL